MMTRTVLGIGLGLALSFAALPVQAKVRGSEVMYVSGTVREVPEKSEGHLFQPKHNELQFLSKEGEIVIPLNKVRTAKYREFYTEKGAAEAAKQAAKQKETAAKKQVKIPLLPALSLPGLPSLNPFGEDKQRVLTLVYVDKEGGEQKVVLLLAKKMVSPVIYALENRGQVEVELEPGDYDIGGE